MNKILFSIVLVFIGLFNAQATIQLPSIFCNNMVLQQNANVKIWGTANYGERLTIVGGWSDKEYSVKADKKGNWLTNIGTPEAGSPYTLTVSGSAIITFDNVMIGEVWLCTGQSNMGFTAQSGLMNGDKEVAAANFPNIRFFKVQRAQADKPQNDCIGQWVECSPESMRRFSSVGYFFGRELHEQLNVPIGLIESTWGGTSIELWTPKEVIYKDPVAHESALIATKWPIENVGTMFNAMIYPLIPFRIAGNIWYQGESNRYNISGYSHLMGLMINAWRTSWDYEFPFFYVQIAPFRYNEPYTAALIREQQLQAMLS
ncbi:sialate O-acetylesterase [Anaerophaga thermohalophila]|uniref:sialate O-acetylesterase n=1 Tax=Anaerophaga thermohalophila TaxID=177400 RepID=UPI000237C0C7|nr:sialate O-acetylesterase [Anaerophaga thermohalophila]